MVGAIHELPLPLVKRMFGKYKIALINPRESPLTPLKKVGTGLLVPLFKGDLGGFTHYERSNWTFQTSSKI
jgi:hypothetical protein